MTFQEWLKTESGRMVSFEKMPRMLEIVYSAGAAQAEAAEIEQRVFRRELNTTIDMLIAVSSKRDELREKFISSVKTADDLQRKVERLEAERDIDRNIMAGYVNLIESVKSERDKLRDQLEQAQHIITAMQTAQASEWIVSQRPIEYDSETPLGQMIDGQGDEAQS